MENCYELNGLVFWTEREIRLRNQFADHFASEMKQALLGMNPAWRFFQTEAPLLTPRSVINQNYTDADVWAQMQLDPTHPALVLRPETTPGSYQYTKHLLDSRKAMPPLVVWQTGKSFRRETDQATKHMRLKEFYQQEFQCVYAADTKNDYHQAMVENVRKMLAEVIGLPTRVVPSDRLPAYSLRTTDVEVWNGDKWMEVCSMSTRTDFPWKFTVQTKQGAAEKDLRVFEVAIGLDRVVYNYERRASGEPLAAEVM